MCIFYLAKYRQKLLALTFTSINTQSCTKTALKKDKRNVLFLTQLYLMLQAGFISKTVFTVGWSLTYTLNNFIYSSPSLYFKVFPSQDPLDRADFNAVEYINTLFPTEQVSPVIVSI